MRANMPLVWLLLLVDVTVSCLGNVFAKRGGHWNWAALATYSLTNLVWLGTLRAGAGQLARTGVLCDLTMCLSTVALGVLVYREALTSRHTVGLFVAVVGIVLLGGGGE